MLIRDASAADLDAIFAIYDEQVLHGTATFETQARSAAERREWFEMYDRARYPVIVGEADTTVLGWARLYPWSPRPAYARTAENAVYVEAGHRGRGVGRLLLDALVQRARRNGIHVIVARIAEGNPGSVALHRACGYERIGLMRGVGEKFGRVLDVELFDLHLE